MNKLTKLLSITLLAICAFSQLALANSTKKLYDWPVGYPLPKERQSIPETAVFLDFRKLDSFIYSIDKKEDKITVNLLGKKYTGKPKMECSDKSCCTYTCSCVITDSNGESCKAFFKNTDIVKDFEDILNKTKRR